MSRGFILSVPASRDTDEILEYILNADGPERALHVMNHLYEGLRRISDSRQVGHRREDLTSAPVLFYRVWSFMVVYNPDSEPVEIIRVLHGARDLKTLLDKG